MIHTKGPWRWWDSGTLVADHGNRPCILIGTPIRERKEDGRLGIIDPEGANARLIAAAPDLLASLKEYVEGYNGTMAERVERAKSAIEKAEGRK